MLGDALKMLLDHISFAWLNVAACGAEVVRDHGHVDCHGLWKGWVHHLHHNSSVRVVAAIDEDVGVCVICSAASRLASLIE
jgi:hypothetical protein